MLQNYNELQVLMAELAVKQLKILQNEVLVLF